MSHVLTVELLTQLVKQVCSHRGYRAAASIAGIDLRDIQQEAALAMLRASISFDPEKGEIEDTCCTSAHRAVAHYLRRAGAPPIRAYQSKDLIGTRSVEFEPEPDYGEGRSSGMAQELWSRGYYTHTENTLHTRLACRSLQERLEELLGDESGPYVDCLLGNISQDDAAFVLSIPTSTFYWRLQRALRVIRAEQT